ncbi:hypothetical protein B0H13DRAFT_2271098 [Mycena leptocephala]|nr:hypothetical protein B0H13DRAFT_2271098 [Mycena leptocephala]
MNKSSLSYLLQRWLLVAWTTRQGPPRPHRIKDLPRKYRVDMGSVVLALATDIRKRESRPAVHASGNHAFGSRDPMLDDIGLKSYGSTLVVCEVYERDLDKNLRIALVKYIYKMCTTTGMVGRKGKEFLIRFRQTTSDLRRHSQFGDLGLNTLPSQDNRLEIFLNRFSKLQHLKLKLGDFP